MKKSQNSRTDRTLMGWLAGERRRRKLSLQKLADQMYDKRPPDVKPRTPRALAVWLNRIQLGRLEEGPTPEEREWIAKTLYPDDDETREHVRSLDYHRILTDAEASAASHLIQFITELPEGAQVSGDYPTAPLAGRDPTALALLFLLIVGRKCELRLFVSDEPSPGAGHNNSEDLPPPPSIVNAALRLILLTAEDVKAVEANTAEDYWTARTCKKKDAKQVFEEIAYKAQEVFDDRGEYHVPSWVIETVLSRIVVYVRADSSDLDELRYNPMTWFLARNVDVDDPFFDAAGVKGNKYALRDEDSAEPLQEHFNKLIDKGRVEHRNLNSSHIRDFAKGRTIKIEVTELEGTP